MEVVYCTFEELCKIEISHECCAICMPQQHVPEPLEAISCATVVCHSGEPPLGNPAHEGITWMQWMRFTKSTRFVLLFNGYSERKNPEGKMWFYSLEWMEMENSFQLCLFIFSCKGQEFIHFFSFRRAMYFQKLEFNSYIN